MLVTRSLPADIDLLALQRLAPQRYPLLLESSSTGTPQGRWDMLLVGNGDSLELGRDGVTCDANDDQVAGDFLSALDCAWLSERSSHDEIRWPFRGGWALFLGYELAAQIEPILTLPMTHDALPVAMALRCPAAVLRDHASGECVILAEASASDMLDDILADVQACHLHPGLEEWQPPVALIEDEPDRFISGVERILDYLAAGDSFQVNLSRGWHAQFDHAADPWGLFLRLRTHNPAPFAGLFAGNGWAVASSSPERLVSVRGDVVETRPIAGTRPRMDADGGDADIARVHELISHPKERAEHVMLIDLERNDLGRVCTTGSVEVDELMTIESYAHVHHIVSNVRGRLRPDATPGDIIRAVFPGGTITGCPKVRCMQIIAELEQCGRGAYTGAFGWLNRDGDLDLNILIRSAEVEGDVVRFRTGAGIVADSDPQRELDETRAKARGMLRALGVES